MAQFSDQQMLKRFSDAVSVEKPRINAFAQSLEKKKEGGLDLQLIIPHIKEVSNFSAYITNYFNQRWAKIDRVKDFLRLLNGVSYNPDTESPQGNIFYSNAPMMHLIYGAFKDSDITLCKNFATVLNAIYQSVFKSQFLNFSSFTDLEKQKMRPDDKAEDLISKLTNNLDQSPQYSAFSTHEDFDLENIFAPKNSIVMVNPLKKRVLMVRLLPVLVPSIVQTIMSCLLKIRQILKRNALVKMIRSILRANMTRRFLVNAADQNHLKRVN